MKLWIGAAVVATSVMSVGAVAQSAGTGTWEITGVSTFRGDTSRSAGSLTGNYQIGGVGAAKFGTIQFQNVSGENRYVQVVGVEPGYAADGGRDWWFTTGGGHNGNGEPGSIMEIGVTFVGHVGGSTVWVPEGSYDGFVTVKDTSDGTLFKVPVTAVAFYPRQLAPVTDSNGIHQKA